MGNILGYPEEDPPIPHTDSGLHTNHQREPVSRPAIDVMVRHVKEVLPQVPDSVIRKDLIITTNVDETITRLLDGTVPYVAEKKPVPVPNNSSSSSNGNNKTMGSQSTPQLSSSLPPLVTSASKFGETAKERHQSFEERKRRLIQEAKERYLAKHKMLQSATKQGSESS